MAIYDKTPILELKKTRRGEREWAENERENWDKLDQFAGIVLSNPPPAGTPSPIFNNEYHTLNVNGVLEPTSITFTYNSEGEIIETIEYYTGDAILERLSQFLYYPDTGLLHICISKFDGIKTTTTYLYDDNGFTTSISSIKEVIT